MLDFTSFDAAMKELYSPEAVENLTYKTRPFLAMVPKMKEFYGDSLSFNVIHGNPQGRSASFSRAQARGVSSNALTKRFTLTRVQDYGYTTIDNETIEASENNKGAFLQARKTEVDGLFDSLSSSLHSSLWRSGWGDIGQVGSFTGATITLKDTSDVVHFEVGQELVLAAAQGSGNIRAVGSSTNGLIITKVNRATGVLTFGYNVDDATNGVPLIANDDYVYVRGDRDESGTITRQKISGVAAWIPYTAPSGGESFFGVDRSTDPTRLAGIRADVSNYPIEEGLIEGLAQAAREGANPDYFFVNPIAYGNLVKALGTKVQYCDLMANAAVGFRGVKIVGQTGDVTVVADRAVPLSYTWGLKLNTWELCSLKDTVRFIGGDKLETLRLASSDGVEVRVGYYANLKCTAPGQNIVLKIA